MLLKFVLADGKIKFVTHTVSWTQNMKQYNQTIGKLDDVAETISRDCFSEEQAIDIQAKHTGAIITELQQPTADLLVRCEGKTFGNYSDAQAFIDGTLPKTELEVLRETVDALVIASLEV